MTHLPSLITDLALILVVAGITTLLFKKMKQPIVLGYIIAGLLVGPNVHLFPTVADLESVKIWADIGVIFLLFTLGLEFSFKKLIKNGGQSAIAGFFEVILTALLGYLTGKLLGWPPMDCLSLGGIIAISSTTIVIRALNESGLRSHRFAGIVFGILVIEDIAAVLVLVLLSTLAVSREFEGSELIMSVVKLAFFLCLWLLAGIFLLPTFFKKVQKFLNEETLLIVSIALCLAMAVFATKIGFSSALGAFMMGSMLAETSQGKQIEKLVTSVKDLFGAIFFVSVGMLIDPHVLVEYALPVFLIAIVVVIGKTVNVTLGSLISGQPLRQSVQSGLTLSQIGEFSFIIATLGESLRVTSSYLYPIAVSVSVVTTFGTPYMMRLAEPLVGWLNKHLPTRVLSAINHYSTEAQTIDAQSHWKKVLRAYASTIAVNSIIILAVILLSTHFLKPFMYARMSNHLHAAIIAVTITLLALSPFIWALTAKKIRNTSYKELWIDTKYNRGPLVMIEVARNVVAILLGGFLFRQFFPVGTVMLIILVVLVVTMYIFSEKLQSYYQRLEKRFMHNLNDKENIQYVKGEKDLSPWDAHFAYFDIVPEFPCIGQSLRELGWREKYGINIVSIERGRTTIYTPGPSDVLYPYDKIGVIGTDVQLQEFKPVMELIPPVSKTADEGDMILDKLIVTKHHPLFGKNIKESGIREKTNGLVVGIERNGERILNPASQTVFEYEDIVWIVGNRKMIRGKIKN